MPPVHVCVVRVAAGDGNPRRAVECQQLEALREHSPGIHVGRVHELKRAEVLHGVREVP